MRPSSEPEPSVTGALGLETGETRRLGYRVVEHLEQRAQGPVIQAASAAELRAALGAHVPELPGDALEAMQTLADVLANMQHGDHPR